MNDKELEEKICVDCGCKVYITHGHARRKPSNYSWRCKSCMSKHRSKIQKESKTNIGKIISKKMSNPNEAAKYVEDKKQKALERWDAKSEEEKKEHVEKIQAGLKVAWQNNFDQYKESRLNALNQYYQNRSKKEALNHKKKLSKARKDFFKNLSSADRERFSQIYKDAWDRKSEETKEAVKQKSIQQWQNMTDEEKLSIITKMSESQKNRWENSTEEERNIHGEKIHNGYLHLADNERNIIIKKHQERWQNMTDEEKYNLLKQTFSKSNNHNNFHKLFESTFKSSYISNEFYIVPETVVSNDGNTKSWDYGIYDRKSNDLTMVIDLDGSYFHADNCDYDGIHSREEYDEKRFLSVPTGIKYCIIYEKYFKRSFQNMIQMLKIDYKDFIESIFKYCRSISFPYPKYTESELVRSYERLVRMNPNDKYHNNISLNTREGDRLITHFHPSIYHAHRRSKPSPYEAWYDDKLLRKCIENRFLYANELNPNKILQGFNVSKIAPKVSVFSAGRAKILINKYLSEYDMIFDPFSGFSGRMLGSISLGKRYIGQDASDVHISESLEMISFLKLKEKVSLSKKDILLSYGEYECLFTCPPYDDKEIWSSKEYQFNNCDDWVDICLSHFKCKRYLFVVDETNKYKNNIVDVITNKSHFSQKQELILLFETEVN